LKDNYAIGKIGADKLRSCRQLEHLHTAS